MKRMTFALAFLACPLLASLPRISNGSVRTLATLEQAASSAGTGWIGYAIPTAEPVLISCCGDNISIRRRNAEDLQPVGESVVYLFARASNGRIERLRIYSTQCLLDAGGQTVSWVENVPPGESIAFLRRVVERGDGHAREDALLALSLHAGATDTLIELARNNSDSHVRSQALFWLSQQAGRKAAAALRDAVDNDPEERVRASAVFGISQLPDDQSVPMLIDLLEHNRSREVRKKAAFWLGQKKDPRALAAIEEILRR